MVRLNLMSQWRTAPISTCAVILFYSNAIVGRRDENQKNESSPELSNMWKICSFMFLSFRAFPSQTDETEKEKRLKVFYSKMGKLMCGEKKKELAAVGFSTKSEKRRKAVHDREKKAKHVHKTLRVGMVQE